METLAAGGPKTIFGTQGTGDVYLLFLASPVVEDRYSGTPEMENKCWQANVIAQLFDFVATSDQRNTCYTI